MEPQDWNSRLLIVLEKTYSYEAKQLAHFSKEGEQEIYHYAKRLAEFRRDRKTKEEIS